MRRSRTVTLREEQALLVQPDLPEWIPLKWIIRLIEYRLSGPIWTQFKVYNMDKWILCLSRYSGPSAYPLKHVDRTEFLSC